MSNKKTDIGTDFEEKLAEIANKKSRTRTNNNIYERFISRVQNTEDNDNANTDTDDLKKLGDANKLSVYEPLSEIELEGFSNLHMPQEDDSLQASDGLSRSIDLDFSDEDEPLITDRTVLTRNDESLDNNDLAAKNSEKLVKKEAANEGSAKTVESSNKSIGSKKPLIIGMVFGSLLIVIIVATLIFTGVLSTSTNTISTETGVNDKVETKAITTGTAPTASTEKTVVTDDNKISTNTSTVDKSIIASQQVASVNGNPNTVNDAETTEVPTADAAITYEDFREESQNTLYRETDD